MTREEFSRHYASLSDEGMREIDRADLIDAARECYDEELARRGLTVEGAAPEVDAAAMGDTVWVPLDTFTQSELDLVRVLLDEAAVPFTVNKDGVLFVPESMLEQAQEVLVTEVSEEDLIAQAEEHAPPEDA